MTNFDKIQNTYPGDSFLTNKIREMLESQHKTLFSSNEFYRLLPIDSNKIKISMILSEFIKMGLLRQVVKVEHPKYGCLGGFSSLTEIPENITFDNIVIPVLPSYIRTYYSK